MNNKLILVMTLGLILMAQAFPHSPPTAPGEIYVIAKINSYQQGKMKLQSQGQTLSHAFQLKDPALSKVLEAMGPDEEAILEGHISYETHRQNDSVELKPIFIIDAIRPISLKKLGKMQDFKPEAKPITFQLEKAAYAPQGFKASDQVVGSITITATILLLKALSTSAREPGIKNQLENNLIFSAGALATGAFLIDQMKAGKD
jgi:hypothetical protein